MEDVYALPLLKDNIHKLDWYFLSKNPNDRAVDLLLANPKNIDWNFLSMNPNDRVIDLLLANQYKIDWYFLSGNKNPKAIKLLEKHIDKIYWGWLSANPSLFELDYLAMKQRTDIFREDLMKAIFHPNRLKKLGVFNVMESIEID